jgi:hypothetical protein
MRTIAASFLPSLPLTWTATTVHFLDPEIYRPAVPSDLQYSVAALLNQHYAQIVSFPSACNKRLYC